MQDWTWLKGGSGLNLTRWDPFDDLVGIRETMNRIFDETFAKRGIARLGSGRTWCPSVDMYETEDNVVVRADLPGVNQKDVELTLTDNALTIRGESKYEKEIEDKNVYRRERAYGHFARTLPITTKIKPDQARAEFKNGVLEVIIPKAPEAKGKTYRLDIH
ncbi:MAG TPA: hypothetical protein DEQ54_03405 [Firmicutes bacterium]|jgi:HSP20 family protein|nr:hypothetical protein [Bacillota bacterium]HCD41653.1 hypothetical protein [Bacillota bacterium]